MIGHWRDRLLDSVAPLDRGVGGLGIYGYRPGGQPGYRPRRTAAVLVGVLDQDQPEILLTQRAAHLTHHPGQVSFPGGAMAAQEETGVLTALREAQEEIGLQPDLVRPLGFLDRLDTLSDFRVLPVVGLVRQLGPWKPDPAEVEAVFTLPLEMALDVDAYTSHDVERHGVAYRIYSLHWQGHRIWGVTAAILHNLALRHTSPGSRT